MKRRLGFTLTLALGLLAIMLVAGVGLGRPASAAEVESPAQRLAAAGGGPIGGTFTVTVESLEEVYPAVAYNPDREEYLVVWYNDRGGNDDIRAQRVSKDGALVGGPFYVAGGSGAERRVPDVTYNGQHQQYLVVWEHNDGTWDNIHARRVSGAGAVLDTTDIVIVSGSNLLAPSGPAVAYSSTSDRYLVVWQATWHPSPLDKDVEGQLVTSSGTLDGGNFTISDDTGSGEYRENPDVVYCRTRDEFLVAWRQRNTSSDYDIYARRVRGDGQLLNPASITISTLGHDEEDPAVAALPIANDEGDYLVAWESDTGSDTGIDAKTVHVASNGSVTVGTLPQVVYDSSVDESNPAVAGNESSQQYLVTWSQHYEETVSGNGFTSTLVYDGIAGRAISKDGDILNGTFMDEGSYIGGWNADRSAVAAGPLGDFLAVYEETPLGESDSDIYGHLWGNRVYLLLVLRNHQ